MRMWLKAGVALPLIIVVAVACATTPSREPATPGPTQTAISPTLSLAHTPTLAPPSKSEPEFVHHADGAGRWYPAEQAKLQAVVDAYVDTANVEPIPGRIVGVIVPHAGYAYSGHVAGYAYRALQEAGCADQTVVVIGDTHAGGGSAQIAVWAEGVFETPLGDIAVDETVAQAIVDADPRIQFDVDAFRDEHPVENQLPFIQTVCPGARIVPVVIRLPSLQSAQILADALVNGAENSAVLIVASTDLSHYHPYAEARRIDEVALQAIVSLEASEVEYSRRRCSELGIPGQPLTMCSEGAVMTALIAAKQMGADQATVLHYATSGDVPVGDRDQVVGYAAVALWDSQGAIEPQSAYHLPAIASGSSEPVALSPAAQEELLALARRTAEEFLTTESFPPFDTDDEALLQPLGAYVTYERDGELRGCLGRLEGDRPAYLNVQYAAAAAAVADSRFLPISGEELKELSIEVTLLYPMRQVESPSEIQIGRDGVMMRVGEKSGALFLPQVPLDEGWDLEDLLANLCRKAGLPDDAWQRPDARFYVFAGQWFGEAD